MLTQNIQVLGERNPKDKLNNINLTRSVRLNDLTQEEMAELYRRGQTSLGTGSLSNGFNFNYYFQARNIFLGLDVVAITFDSKTQAVVFDCGYSTVYNRYFRVLLTKGTDGTYSWSQRITAPTWVDESDLKTINGESLIGTGNIEIKGGGDETPTGTTLYFTTTDGQTLNANIEATNKAGTVIEPSLKTPTAWYYDEVVETMMILQRTENCNLYSLNGVNIPVKLTDVKMSYIMKNCRYADLRKFFTNGLTDLVNMFAGSISLEWVDVSNFNTSDVTDMHGMFMSCFSLASLDVSHFNTSNVMNMSGMFRGCKALTSLDLSHFNTSNVTDMRMMFRDCSSLASLDLSNWDTSNVTDMSSMFRGCNALKTITMKNCSQETIDKIKAALTEEGILSNVQIITA